MVIKYKDIKNNIFNLNEFELFKMTEFYTKNTKNTKYLYDGYALVHVDKSDEVIYSIILNKRHNKIEVI